MKINRYFIALAVASLAWAAAPSDITIPEEKPFPESLLNRGDWSLRKL